VEAAVLTALEKLPADRFSTAAAFGEAVAHPTAISTTPRAPAVVRAFVTGDAVRWRRVAGVVAVLAFVLGALAVWGLSRSSPPAALRRFVVQLEAGRELASPCPPGTSPDVAHCADIGAHNQQVLLVRDLID